MPAPRRKENCDPRTFEEPDYLRRLVAAGARASSVGIAVLDSQTRFEAVNASMSREMRSAPNDHIGRTPYEVVGDIVLPAEKVCERVLSFGQPESLLIKGRVRNTPEFGYWLNHYFPIKGSSGRVGQIGVFGVNVTAEKAAAEIFGTLATSPMLLMAEGAGLLDKFDESVRHYHHSLEASFEELACPFTESSRKVDRFRSSVVRLDEEICIMRELIYAVIAHFVPSVC
jgi:hypothetical protein